MYYQGTPDGKVTYAGASFGSDLPFHAVKRNLVELFSDRTWRIDGAG